MGKHKDRAPAPMPDIACCTVTLDRTTGEVQVTYESRFVRSWEVAYMLEQAAEHDGEFDVDDTPEPWEEELEHDITQDDITRFEEKDK